MPNPRAVPPQIRLISTPDGPHNATAIAYRFRHLRDREVRSRLEPAGIHPTRIEIVMTFSCKRLPTRNDYVITLWTAPRDGAGSSTLTGRSP